MWLMLDFRMSVTPPPKNSQFAGFAASPQYQGCTVDVDEWLNTFWYFFPFVNADSCFHHLVTKDSMIFVEHRLKLWI